MRDRALLVFLSFFFNAFPCTAFRPSATPNRDARVPGPRFAAP